MKNLKYIAAVALTITLTTLLSVAIASAQTNLTPEQILDKVDENMTAVTMISTSKMIIYKNNRVDEKIMKSWNSGKKKGFAEFLEPARDKGTKYLRIGDELWMYLPSVEKVIKISGHLLRQSMMGSDFSYEDALDRAKMRDDYDVTLTGDEDFDGKPCYVLELIAKHKKVTYFKRTFWVDKSNFIPVKSEMYAKSGKLLKVSAVKEVKKFGDRYYPTITEMVDKLKKNSRTEFVVIDADFNPKMNDFIFTRRNLEKK